MANLIPRDLPGREELLGKLMNSFWQERQMNTDIKEYEDHYVVKADLPGIKKENIRVSFVNDTLTISASQIEESEEKDDLGHYLRKERSSSAYQRAFTIPDIDEEAIKARFEDGVLSLNLPKASYKDAPGKHIPIE
ncbi:Hsp20/alpha crystallin family protein [Enterococcus gallinarum]|uniref:Hsp20/alpha crystallin family protein n=1 Tax=Enterococcus gallinarum TaxID=1353 RepID=UPI001AD697ED|nr:Hsp20/alpha crystallin family protein [Enterococcus gallinarum]MBO6332608.1 Hsp20/alpha crystallin family protein [Enterococcus gallinarum]MBO6353334.1 Hsp20/alpha crystallin family protein [Enterococcus gallinarum]MBO6393697.1 Hsp20/alpha crystallin family protein [Enterococcus gallinarum]MBO6423897.1 Hsp20/alpha crystallin family protein [Enterococcus gallinarum]MDV7743133.1 Hsp20/alpha crystallin family protein [Enterococcus gallinarum]